jgi:hypothetical protein
MNAKQMKAIRKHVNDTKPFLSAESLYTLDDFGSVVLHTMCKKAHYQNIKRNMKRNG